MLHTARALIAFVTVVLLAVGAAQAQSEQPAPPKVTEGQLRAVDAEGRPVGLCPLKHTDVQAVITGLLARVTVTQEFHNPFEDKIEAVYVFPLRASAAVHDMTMTVGDRVIRGLIKERDEARKIYEQAKAAGHVAGLLDQERPNIFTQSVANIEPGKAVTITISYTELLTYEDGKVSFVFPMVVGPRYIPGAPTGQAGTGWAEDTDEVPDASRITPPVTPKDTRAGHDISLAVALDAGAAIHALRSEQHGINMEWQDTERSSVAVQLANKKEIPNKDFVLVWSTVTDAISDATLAGVDERGGFFLLMLQPPEKVQPDQIMPREIIFVLDTSGSMRGFPIETSKSIMRRAIKELRHADTFNLITFAGTTKILWDKLRANTEANRAEAMKFVDSLEGGGGTEMMKAIHAALAGEHDPEKIRIVAFLTDGYVGNDMAIIDAVQKNARTTRVFSFGIGTSVNRYLLGNMARAGRGEAAYALNQGQAEKTAEQFYDRINAPVLTDVAVDFGDLADAIEADELYPQLIPDLFSAKPVVLYGRYKPGAADRAGTITLRGQTVAGPFERKLKVTLPASADPGAIPAMWARKKVAHLMSQDLSGIQQGSPDPAIKESIIGLGITYRLMTRFTSFVAVEEKVVTVGGKPRTVAVPVEMPEGVSYEGVFGDRPSPVSTARLVGSGGGGGGGGFAAMALPEASVDEDNGRKTQDRQVQQIRDDEKLSDEEKRQKIAELKLDKALHGLADKLDADGNYADKTLSVSGGKLEVAVYLTDLSDEVLAKLKELGFEKILDASAVKMVIGTIEVARLADLAQLDEVRRIGLPELLD
ncbi:hypothetical protein LCGC14_0284950 [marine sediment metagenome]|uniref:VWFA domain-containing protein n=1 Tax=marine sediment metagenome TaxID=412755 RepID=A0A0F9WG23_9ZZZZ|nr:VWA domain-containing protein [Phycisphaerae bacterium]HDZ45027.1 VWA domain-containing protein [Phycisphaerae bacterium]